MVAAGSNVAFAVVFAVFVVALLTLFVIVVVWAVRRDRARRAEWVLRYQRPADAGDGPTEGTDHEDR